MLTSVEPNYGYVLGGETITIFGGPFYSRSNFSYECHFGDKVSPAVTQSINSLSCATPTSLVTQKVNLTVWMNGLNYAPHSVLSFAYYECQTFAQTSCNSFCMAQPHCGWCVSSSSCTSASRCNAATDVFLSQCLSMYIASSHFHAPCRNKYYLQVSLPTLITCPYLEIPMSRSPSHLGCQTSSC